MIPPVLHSPGLGSHVLRNAHQKVRGDSPYTANSSAVFDSLSSTLACHSGANLQDLWVNYLYAGFDSSGLTLVFILCIGLQC